MWAFGGPDAPAGRAAGNHRPFGISIFCIPLDLGKEGAPMTHHLTYLEAVVTGLVQGVSELFPVSSLGHNVLLPALIGGSWANDLSVSAPGSPYLAFIVGLHVATAIAMIAFFWRDWLRIVLGFVSSLRTRSVTTPDERLAWMIILATIPVGLVGLVFQKTFTTVFAKPEFAAVFLAVNGVILLVSERMRRSRGDMPGGGAATVVLPAGGGVPSGPVPGAPGRPAWGPGGPAGPGGPHGPGRPARPGPEGYSQQPRQQQWQGPDPRDPRYGDGGNRQYPGNGQGWQPQQGQPQFRPGPQGGQGGQPGYGQRPPAGYGNDPRGGQPQYGADDRGGYDPRDPRDPRGGRGQQQGGRHGRPGGYGPGERPVPVDGGAADPAVAADRRLSAMGYGRAVLVGASQILALFPGISRDGIVTVTGMSRGLSRQDAVRFSFLLSAPVILAAGALKAKDLTGPTSHGMHGPIIVGSLLAGIGAYLSIRFLVKYFNDEKSLNPFGIYCLVAGILSFAYLVLK
jgi:undecaprenyl pyrophosphate phosphatase UppP